MSEISDKYYSQDLLKEIARNNGIGEEHAPVFISLVEKVIEEIVETAELEESEYAESALEQSISIMGVYSSELKKGHGHEWAMLYADTIEQHAHAFNQAYKTLKQKKPELALDELKIHCKSAGGNELYTKHFIFLMENGEALSHPDELAAIYAEAYAEQIALGKSELFAHHYGDNVSEDKLYAYTFASFYEEAVKKEKSPNYAFNLADKMGEYVANYFKSYDAALNDELFKIELQRVEQEIRTY